MNLRWALILIFFLSGCGFNGETMFEKHVYADVSQVTLILSGKVQCMHCPMFFEFKASDDVVDKIIKQQALSPVVESFAEVRKLNELVARYAESWPSVDSSGSALVLAVFYSGENYEYEPAFRVLMRENGKIYFITSGFFNKEHYYKDNA